MKKGILFILSAPSGAGKSTVLKRVMANLKGLAFSVSHTTRVPRTGETDGVEYHFVDRSDFLQMKKNGEFLECADVHDNYYGTSRLAVEQQLDNGLDVILDIDVQGARIIQEAGELQAVYIFLAPPDLQELERRLRGRGLDSEVSISKRLDNAEAEMQAMVNYEYIVVNDNLDDAVRMFEAVILSERSKNRRGVDGTPLTVSLGTS